MATTSVFLLGLAIAVAATGFFLIVSGLRRVRWGFTQFCRQCNYNLTGNMSGQCPECGADLNSADAIVTGRRRRRYGRFFTGLVCLVIGSSPFWLLAIGVVQTTNWYTHAPTWWVLLDVQSGNRQVAVRAVKEIAQRYAAGKLSTRQRSKLIEVGLKEQTRPKTRNSVTAPLLDVLGAIHDADQMSPEHAARFFENMVASTRLEVRPIWVVGIPQVIQLHSDTRAPGDMGVRIRFQQLHIDGELVHTFPGGSCSACGVSVGVCGTHFNTSRLSPREKGLLQLDYDVYVHRAAESHQTDDPKGLHERTSSAQTEIQILAEPPPDYIRFTRSAEIDQQVAASVRLYDLMFAGGLDAEVTAHVQFEIQRINIALALEVWVVQDGKPTFVDMLTCKSGPHPGMFLQMWEFRPGSDPIDVVLRPCKRAAYTCTASEFWDGALVFKDIGFTPLEGAANGNWYHVPNATTHVPRVVDPDDLPLPNEVDDTP